MNDGAGVTTGFPSERERAVRALRSGAALGLALALLSGLRRLMTRAGSGHSSSKN